MELVPALMIAGSLSSSVGSGLLYWYSPPDVADSTFDAMRDTGAAKTRRVRSRAGFFLMTIGSLLQLTAGLIWYQQPARWG